MEDLIDIFEANFLDGDKIQGGQMIASAEVKEFVEKFVKPYVERLCIEAKKDGARGFKDHLSLTNQMFYSEEQPKLLAKELKEYLKFLDREELESLKQSKETDGAIVCEEQDPYDVVMKGGY